MSTDRFTLDIGRIAEKFGMDYKGEAYFHDENFLNNHKLPCYVPLNTEDVYDIYSRNDIDMQVREWLDREDTKEYLLESYDGVMPVIDEDFISNWVVNVYQNVSWQHPSTYLQDQLT
jgi:hypothetical protein